MQSRSALATLQRCCFIHAKFRPHPRCTFPPGGLYVAASPLCVGSCARAFGYFSCQLASLGHTFRNATLITSSQAAKQPSRLRRRRQRVDKSKCRRDMSSPHLTPTARGRVCIIHGTEPKKVPHSLCLETETELAARLADCLAGRLAGGQVGRLLAGCLAG